MIIAIDGPAGSGKSTVATLIAEKLNYRYINTGAMYRAVAWKAQQDGVDLNDERQTAQVAARLSMDFAADGGEQKILVDGNDVTPLLRDEKVGRGAAIVASQPKVRELLTEKQRGMGRQGNVVMEGRDIGTVVFPQADKKFYFHADPAVRGKRRYLELQAKRRNVDLDHIIEQIKQRDYEDAHRKIAPLARAKDAIYMDTTHLNIEEVVNMVALHIGAIPTSEER